MLHDVEQWVSNFSVSESCGRHVKTQIAGLHSRIFDSIGLGWELRICMSHKLPGDAAAAGSGTTLGELLM